MNYHQCKQLFIASMIILALFACAQKDSPYYQITDSQRHTFEGGDFLQYSAVNFKNIGNDENGLLKFKYSASTLNNTPDFQTIDGIVESNSTQGGLTSYFPTLLLSKLENNEQLILAILEADETYWLQDTDSDSIGKILYNTAIDEITEQQVLSSALQNCKNRICTVAGTINISLNPKGQETITTDYAKFDAFRFGITLDILLNNSESTLTQKSWHYSGTQWIYPKLGMVKFEYDIQTDNGTQVTSIGLLADTNIPIPTENKSDK